MPGPSPCLHFGPKLPQNVTEGTRQNKDQANKALIKWVQQQEEELRKIYGSEVEVLPLPLLQEELEGVFEGPRLTPIPPDSALRHNHSGSPSSDLASSTSSHRWRRCRQPATLAAAAAATEPSTPAHYFCHVRDMEIRRGASFSFIEGSPGSPSTCLASQASLPRSPATPINYPAPSSGYRQQKEKHPVHRSPVKPLTPAWVQSTLAALRAAYINSRCLETAAHLASNPQDCASVPLALQKEFQDEGLFDAPVSAGGPPASSILAAVPASVPAHGSSAASQGSPAASQGSPATSKGSPAASQGSLAASQGFSCCFSGLSCSISGAVCCFSGLQLFLHRFPKFQRFPYRFPKQQRSKVSCAPAGSKVSCTPAGNKVSCAPADRQDY
ncbi:hypothetical protein CRENBAI_011481 [Crenichthys baileyi]|uniref:Uncharacterized protein n=1 Tax=Crenichthys baileyi TaxID=28760 RepID=A0AAV9RM59_9TELE